MTAIINLFKKKTFEHFFSHKPHLQEGEDLACLAFFNALRNNGGLYVHIGTHYAYPFSKKKQVLQKGWQRIIIEPASGSKNLLALFPGNDKDGSVKRATLLTDAIIKTINVRKMPLTKILDDHVPVGQTIDFLSIDASGFDMAAFKAGSWNKYSPSLIIVNAETPHNGIMADRIYRLLKRKNYTLISQTVHASFFKLKEVNAPF